jgi:predicted metalloprotease
MRWDRGHESPDVVDARGRSSGIGGMGGGAIFGLFRVASMFGWKGIVVAAVLVAGFMCFSGGLGGLGGMLPGGPTSGPQAGAPQTDEQLQFVSFALDDVQSVWDRELPGYTHTKLVVFRDQTQTGCGYGQSATGPFYCPLDQQVYIDLSFYEQLASQFGAPGDFAQAYVIAHEVGHHVQHLRGATEKVPRRGAEGANGASVRLELQADCYAGVWAHDAQKRGVLEGGDLEEGLAAAAAIGDDRLQKQGGGRVTPDSFTHGTSEQRVRWLRRGFESGSPSACDTLSASRL